MAFLHTTNKCSKKDNMDILSFAIGSKKIKYVAIMLTKDLKKEIDNDTRQWKYEPCSCIGRLDIVKMTVLPKQFTDSMQCNCKQDSSSNSSQKWEKTLKSYVTKNDPRQSKQFPGIKIKKKRNETLEGLQLWLLRYIEKP